jgi:hypothetical protein
MLAGDGPRAGWFVRQQAGSYNADNGETHMKLRRALGWGLLGIVGAWLVAAAWLRYRGPDAEQAAALATLSAPNPPLLGRNAADAFWLAGHRVPDDQRAATLAALRDFHEREAALRDAGKGVEADALVDPLDAFPEIEDAPPSPELCELRQRDCLGTVRNDPAATGATLAKYAEALQRGLSFAGYDGYRYERTTSLNATLPQFATGRRLAYTHFAARFVQGDTAGALQAVCADLRGWRRIGGDSDQLIASMIGTAFASQDLQLLAEMAAELPTEQPLPAACTAALAPATPAELDLCSAIRGEFAMLRNGIAAAAIGPDLGATDRFMARLLSADRYAAHVAPQFAYVCSDAARAQVQADQRVVVPAALSPRCARWESALDPVTCIVIGVSGETGFPKYLDRRTDLAAQIGLVRTALWLRDGAGDARPAAQRLRERPAEFGLRREVTLEDGGRTLAMPAFDPRVGTDLRVPLPQLHAAVEPAGQ